ncbi:hypothetical protein ACHAQK_009275 [Fusarium lateritium]
MTLSQASSMRRSHANQGPQTPSRDTTRHTQLINTKAKTETNVVKGPTGQAEGNRAMDQTISKATQRRRALEQNKETAQLPVPKASKAYATGKRKRLTVLDSSSENSLPASKHKRSRMFLDDDYDVIPMDFFVTNCLTTHTLEVLPVGSYDLQLAIKNCTHLFEGSHGVQFIEKAVRWFKADLYNPVVWNALETKEMKEEYMKYKLGE